MTGDSPDSAGERLYIEVPLRDGSMAELAPVTTEDRELLVEGLGEMSEESRFARFGSGRSSLSDSEIRYLTDVDQVHHVAWGATIEGRAAGIGRYIVDRPGEAEIAVTVVDRHQRKGLGRALFDALVASARAGGIEVLWFSIEPWNRAVIEMMRGFEVRFDEEDGMLSGRIEVDAVPVGKMDDEFVASLERCRRGRSG